jgi:hypothetical protein
MLISKDGLFQRQISYNRAILDEINKQQAALKLTI